MMRIGSIDVKQFAWADLNRLEGHGRVKGYWFECSMISACTPLFDHLFDNYEVQRELEYHKVFGKNDIDDTESSALVVNFKDKRSGRRFIDRLNKYLVKRAKEMQ